MTCRSAVDPRLAGLPAVRSGQVYVADGSHYFSRPGPRLVDSLEILAHALHPEVHPFPHGLPPPGSYNCFRCWHAERRFRRELSDVTPCAALLEFRQGQRLGFARPSPTAGSRGRGPIDDLQRSGKPCGDARRSP